MNWHYRSTRMSIAEAAQSFARDVAPRLHSAPRVHFLTHSLGGIVVRHFLAGHPLPNLGRVHFDEVEGSRIVHGGAVEARTRAIALAVPEFAPAIYAVVGPTGEPAGTRSAIVLPPSPGGK